MPKRQAGQGGVPMDMQKFIAGNVFDAYKTLGCHLEVVGAVFRTYAPNASRVSLIGEFSGWKELDMFRDTQSGIWECYVSSAEADMMYKYRIYDSNGYATEHCDPYGYGMELRPNWASIIRDMSSYQFQDEEWMRERNDRKSEALNIYELHLGSWLKNYDSETGWLSYAQIAEPLALYVKDLGYNCIELLPIAEYPADNSWGYQGSGFFSPTSRYGTADELKYFIDYMHGEGISVILDFVPVHFAVDWYALARYDGTCMYEYPYPDIEYSEWGSKNFHLARGEVRSFLQSSANYWISEYHFDGIRIDAISNIIYWQGNQGRGENREAVEFIRKLNTGLKALHPDVMLIAEDSTAYPGVTKAVSEGGLGFDYKWDMGWMNDTLVYFQMPPASRKEYYHKLTFSMLYYYSERFLMPLSHDEVVHGKGTILQKMYGDYELKFPQARVLYMYMYAHPGKQLNFMGNEIGHFREWDERREQDWLLLDFPKHQEFARFMTDLNHFYMEHPAMWKHDFEREGFLWIDCHQEEKCIYLFKRMCAEETIVLAMNCSDEEQEYELDQKEVGAGLQLVMNSDWDIYGGTQLKNQEVLYAEDGKLTLKLAPFSAQYYFRK